MEAKNEFYACFPLLKEGIEVALCVCYKPIINHRRQQNSLQRHRVFYTRKKDLSTEWSLNHAHKQMFGLQMNPLIHSYNLQHVPPTRLHYFLLSLDHVVNSLDIAVRSALELCILHELMMPIPMLLPSCNASFVLHDLVDLL